MSSCGPAGDECRVCVEAPVYQNETLTGTLEVDYLGGRAVFNDVVPTVDHSAVTLVFSLCYNQGEDTVLVGKAHSDTFVVRPERKWMMSI